MSFSESRLLASSLNARITFLFQKGLCGDSPVNPSAIIGIILDNTDNLDEISVDAIMNASNSIPGIIVEISHNQKRSEIFICGRMDAVETIADELGLGYSVSNAIQGYNRRNFHVNLPIGRLKMGPENPLIMGVLNVTPDSFSDGGQFFDNELAVEHGLEMARSGAHIIDVGGESTRPGAPPVPPEEQIKRISPVVKKLAEEGIVVSIDTASAAVAQKALDDGAQLINDVSALRADDEMVHTVARAGVPVVLMHMLGSPSNMQKNPCYEDVVADIARFLRERIEFAVSSGIDKDQIIIDPGIGFGKTVEHNLEILRRLSEFRSLGRPLLLGTSRKSFIGHVIEKPVEERLMGTASTLALGAAAGASIFRVHDVREASQVIKMTEAIMGKQQ